MKIDLVDHVKKSFRLAEENYSKIEPKSLIGIKGQTGIKNVCLLNNICSLRGLNYLEIGLFNGLTFCSSLYKNEVNAIGIDNWSEFNGKREIFDSNLERFIGKNNVNIIEGDCFSKESLSKVEELTKDRKINFYNYDGGHSLEDHLRAITLYDRFMDDEFVIMIDDWQQLDVQRGTILSLKEMKYDILWENHCRSVNDDIENWWCGTYIGVLRKIV